MTPQCAQQILKPWFQSLKEKKKLIIRKKKKTQPTMNFVKD